MVISINGKAARNLMNELPFYVFDMFCDEFGDMLVNDEDLSKYVHWEETNEEHTADDVAEDYGFENLEDMQDDGTYGVIEFDEGLLLVE